MTTQSPTPRLYDVRWTASGTFTIEATSPEAATRQVEEMLLVGSIDSELVDLGDCYPKAVTVEPKT